VNSQNIGPPSTST